MLGKRKLAVVLILGVILTALVIDIRGHRVSASPGRYATTLVPSILRGPKIRELQRLIRSCMGFISRGFHSVSICFFPSAELLAKVWSHSSVMSRAVLSFNVQTSSISSSMTNRGRVL